MKQVTRALSS